MMSGPDLTLLARTLPREELPELVGKCAEAQAVAMARLATVEQAPVHAAQPEQATLLTPEQAAEIAAVPVRRIYVWSRGKAWASRLSARCLRIQEPAFRRWLQARGKAA